MGLGAWSGWSLDPPCQCHVSACQLTIHASIHPSTMCMRAGLQHEQRQRARMTRRGVRCVGGCGQPLLLQRWADQVDGLVPPHVTLMVLLVPLLLLKVVV